MNSKFPVFIYSKDLNLPDSGTYFVVAGNGLWMHKDTGICRCFVPVENLSFLDDLDANSDVNVDLPKIPFKIVWQVKTFFEMVVKEFSSESEVTLYFNKETQEYRVHIPEQTVCHGGVKYKRIGTIHLKEMEGFLRVGTIHSHCDFDAFHSHTDIGDEEDFDGIHITFGNNDKEEFTVTSSVVVNGFRKTVDPLDFLEGIIRLNDDKFKFESISDQQELWKKTSEIWLKNVNNKDPQTLLGLKEDSSLVDWSDEMKSAQMKATLGSGPFKVISRENGKLLIETLVGETELSEHFFKFQ